MSETMVERELPRRLWPLSVSLLIFVAVAVVAKTWLGWDPGTEAVGIGCLIICAGHFEQRLRRIDAALTQRGEVGP
jgi:hypothetical protein